MDFFSLEDKEKVLRIEPIIYRKLKICFYLQLKYDFWGKNFKKKKENPWQKKA